MLYDPFRKEWVKETPEEKIRQGWLQKMTQELGYPVSLLAIEKELKTLPHLSHQCSKDFPKRRIDIVAFAKDTKNVLFPLLLLECKSKALIPAFARQVIGYNDIVKAPFVAIANAEQVLVGHYDGVSNMYKFTQGLSSYSALLNMHKQLAFK